MKQPAVYIVTNQRNGTLYTGVTTNLIRRIYEHKNDLCDGFTKKYNCKVLVYYELYDDIELAITREKEIKGWSRQKKLMLLEASNPNWRDLYDDIV